LASEKPVVRGRVSLLKVPLDIIPPDDLPEIVYNHLLQPADVSVNVGVATGAVSGASGIRKQGKDIVLLSVWDLLRARGGEYRDYVLRASMVIPISKSLINGARFLTGKTLVRYMPFYFFINLLSILENREFTIYLLGGNEKILRRVENNIHTTFPRLRIIGRCVAKFKKQEEGAILEAIRKASPHLLIVGRGVKGGELWIARNSSKLGSGLRIWCSDLFDVFAEKKRRPSDGMFNLGLESLFYFVRSPLKFFRIFSYMRFKSLLLIYKIMGKD